MNKLSLLILFCSILLRANGQAGSLDHAFGNNGMQTTAFFSDTSYSSEEGRVVLTGNNGEVYIVARLSLNPWYTRIVKYLPGGKLDSSYGSNGYSNTANLNVKSAVLQGNKIIIAGNILNSGIADDFGLARYTAKGTLDTSFGVNGIVKTNFNTYYDEGANAVALQGNKIIVAGYTTSPGNFTDDIALLRYNTDGVLDSSFGKNGLVTTDFGNTDERANAIVLQGNKIIVGGYTYKFADVNYYDFLLARYNADGTLDSSFGKNGEVATDFSDSYDVANAVALQGGKIILSGYSENAVGFYYDFALVRYTTNGKIDSSFGKNGKVRTDFNNSYDNAYAMILQGDKILLAGNSTADIALARYAPDGTLDSTFGNNGKVLTDFNGNEDHAYSIALYRDNIIVAGSTFYYVNGFPSDFAITRYTANGKLAGKRTGYFPVTRTFFTSSTTQGNKIIAAGYAFDDSHDNDFLIARHNPDGKPDSNFGTNGVVTTDFNNLDDRANSIVLQGNKIIVGGYSGDIFNGYDFVLARYTAKGVLDSTFGNNGKTTVFTNSNDRSNAILLQGSKILITAFAFNQENFTTDFALVRYTANGRLDSTFGKNGMVTTDFGNSYDRASSIALQGNKIIVGGSSDNFGNSNFALARYTANGRLDASFGENGIVITDFDNADDLGDKIALEGDGIIMSGNSGDFFGGYNVVIARYTANGILDASFGENGKLTTGFHSPYGQVSLIAVQENKIIAGSNVDNSSFSFYRYTANGSPDTSFGKGGKVITDLVGASTLGAITVHQKRLYAAGSVTFGPDESYGLIAAYRLEAPVPVISISDVTVSESEKLAAVTVQLSSPVTTTGYVHIITKDNTAVHSQDYIRVNDTLLLTPGKNTTFKILIPIVDDHAMEAAEQFEVLLTRSVNATIKDSAGIVTIIDDDAALIAKQNASLRVNAIPNPSANAFTVRMAGLNVTQPVNIRVYDITGRLIEERIKIGIGQMVRLGDQYIPGIYIIEGVQGDQKVQTKVIKSGK